MSSKDIPNFATINNQLSVILRDGCMALVKGDANGGSAEQEASVMQKFLRRLLAVLKREFGDFTPGECQDSPVLAFHGLSERMLLTVECTPAPCAATALVHETDLSVSLPFTNGPDVWNWSRTLRIGPSSAVLSPASEMEIQEILRRPELTRVRVIGSRLSFGSLLSLGSGAGDGCLLELGQLRGLISHTDSNATFAAGTTLEEVFATLKGMGRMLPCSPGVISKQTLAGAMATGTHGQGLGQSTLSDVVTCFRLVLTDGHTLDVDRLNPIFGAVQLSLGALGIVTEITLETTPFLIFSCKKCATDTSTLLNEFPSWNKDFAFCKAWWFPETDKVHCWLAREANAEETQLYTANGGKLVEASSLGSMKKDESLNDTIAKTINHLREDTRDEKESGDQFKTLTRFRDFTDVIGDIYQIFCKGIPAPQINLEIAIPFDRVQAVLQKIHEWYSANHPHMHYPIILRSTDASTAWLSPAHGRSVCYFGFVVYFAADGGVSEEGVKFLNDVQRLLVEEGGRPHWGKCFDDELYDWAQLYPRWDDFKSVRQQLDPAGKLTNPFLEKLFASKRKQNE